ncbi:MAG TPA: DUF1684 domain-containing protein [Chitinophagaceae bacterium]|nr:DUF1684 domain-containing protein [Chitinophagaceae bacterium]
MIKYAFLLLIVFCSRNTEAQLPYPDSIALFRKHYKEDFIKEERSPLKGNDTAYLRFFPVNKAYAVNATLELTPKSPQFQMQTHSGKVQQYRQYGVANFILKGKKYKLHLYQNLSLIQQEKHKNHLFLPFNDLTNYESTYGGGRYIDLSTDNIHSGTIRIDFNKCYNPYCAFKEGYSCPIPPVENRLQLRIEAGEKLFGKKTAE